jgi:hypothetical protein
MISISVYKEAAVSFLMRVLSPADSIKQQALDFCDKECKSYQVGGCGVLAPHPADP